jgi:small-conductance mechanosensitive channel
VETPLSETTPNPDSFDRVASRQLSFGKIAGIFLVLGPPLFGVLFWLLVSLANPNSDPFHEKTREAVGVALSIYGLMASYAVGLLPFLILTLVYARSRRHLSGVGRRFLVAALIGAVVYFIAFAILLIEISGGLDRDYRLFAIYATAAGAVSSFVCAFILEEFLTRAAPPA